MPEGVRPVKGRGVSLIMPAKGRGAGVSAIDIKSKDGEKKKVPSLIRGQVGIPRGIFGDCLRVCSNLRQSTCLRVYMYENRDLAEISWEDNLMPAVPIAMAHRDLIEGGWDRAGRTTCCRP